jgi:hypothetical protein
LEYFKPNISKKEGRQLLYAYGPIIFREAFLLQGAQGRYLSKHDLQEKIDYTRTFLNFASEWEAPIFPIGGKDLVTLGVDPGPTMGFQLKQIEQWWVDRDFQPSCEQCLDYFKRNIL